VLRSLRFDGYRAFPAGDLSAEPTQALEFAPLTLLIGRNNAGKTSALSLLHSTLRAIVGDCPTVLPLEVGGRSLGQHFRDLLPQGDILQPLRLDATFADGGDRLQVTLMVRGALAWNDGPMARTRLWNGSPLPTSSNGWSGSLLRDVPGAPQLQERARELLANSVWLGPLRIPTPDIPLPNERRTGEPPLGPRAEGLSSLLQDDRALFDGVQHWLDDHTGVSLRWEHNLDLHRLMARRGSCRVPISQLGDGIHQVLPVVALETLRRLQHGTRPFMDVIQQPELHLHDALHPALGDLLLDAAPTGGGITLVETHSEGLLLRVRRRIAEDSNFDLRRVAIYYVDDTPEGSALHRVPLTADGDVSWWPEGVFFESFEEVKAIRRAQRARS
jgi:hypothetical protein